MTYDCISDCLGRDSIPAPRSAGDGGIARSERWRNTGVCGSNVLVSAILHLREIWRLNVRGDGGMTGGGAGKLECVQPVCCLLSDVFDGMQE